MSTEVNRMGSQRVHRGEIEIPSDIEVSIKNNNIIMVKGPLGEIEKDFSKVPIKFRIENNKIEYEIFRKGKKGYALINTIRSKINNMFIGVKKGFTYRMKAFYVHFPINVEVSGEYVIIKNFAGERGVRKARKMPGVKVNVIKKGSDIDIIIKGVDKDAVGQTAANVYLATKVKSKDPRVFLDGIYVYYKGEGM